ncbi:MAG: hypothetical protein HUJ54_12655 [Erysipelotrichaceae bacterium]|nr:hypothetical protein [Erysipelotrichaceae bacterium]
MGFLLETVSPAEFSEINQYITLEGVICPAAAILGNKVKVSQLIDEFLNIMAEDQRLYLPVISAGFRPMLAEIRQTAAISSRIVVMIPAVSEGLMCLKACRTLKIPVILSGVQSMAMAAFGYENHAPAMIMDAAALEETGSALSSIQAACKKYEDCTVMAGGFTGLQQVNQVLMDTEALPVLTAHMAAKILSASSIPEENRQIRYAWAETYFRTELCGDEGDLGE